MSALNQTIAMEDSIKEIIGKVEAGEKQRKVAFDEVMLKLTDNAELVEVKEAVKQLEEDQAKLEADTSAALKRHRSLTLHDPTYKGIWPSERESRSFGLAVMGTIGKNKRALDILKSENPDIHEMAMANDPDSAGGALVPAEYSDRLIRLVEEAGVAEGLCGKWPMASDRVTFPKRTGGVSVFLVGENTAPTESQPTYSNVVLTAKKWGTLSLYPNELEEDAAADIGELVAEEIVTAYAAQEDSCVFAGDGTSTYFGITGVPQRLIDVNGVDDGGGIVLGTGNAWSELTDDNFLKTMGTLPRYPGMNPSWICSRNFYFQVIAPLVLAGGGVTKGEIEGKLQMLLFGDPVKFTQEMPTTEANSKIPVLYGDLKKAVTIGRRKAMQIKQSKEYKFGDDQTTVLGIQRLAINAHSVGTATAAGPVVGLITAAS